MRVVSARRQVAVAIALSIVVSLVPFARAQAVVGGAPSSVRAHPWLVSLHDEDGQQCGGALIRRNVVLTAAHCTEGYVPADIEIVAGSTRADGRGGQRRAVVDIVEPAAYSRSDGFDVALVYLNRPVRRSAKVDTIGLATAEDLRSAAAGIIAGWGAVGENEAGVMRVRDATVRLLADGPCRRQMRRVGERIVPRRELCARAGATDSCYGDSGGPLIVDNTDGAPVVAGIVSWGVECAGTTPGVYAEVPFFRRWIINHV